MNVIVDSSIWSLALRRSVPKDEEIIRKLRDIITDGRAILLGAIRQEVLSGIRHTEQFTRLRDYLRAFPDLELTTEDYERAADFFNICRRNGIQGSNTDFLICAAAHNRGYSIFTSDRDFYHFANHIPIILY